MAGFSSVTGQQSIMFADNCSFDGTQRGGAMTTNGQLWIGSTAAPHVATGSLTSPLGTISIGYSAPNITLDATGTSVYHYTAVNHAASPYTVLSTDYYLGVTVTAGVVTILLPNAPTTGRVFIVKDTAGDSATNNITITTVGGAVTIDGATSYTINTNYEAIQLIFNGTSYEVF
jgi:hypothetical protein